MSSFQQSPADLTRLRCDLGDRETTVHVARFDLESTSVRVASVPMLPLASWCEAEGIDDAMVGGFFIRAAGVPLGDLWISSVGHASEAFTAPWDATRACVHVLGEELRIAPRDRIGHGNDAPVGDLLQAGPMLVDRHRPLIRDGIDPEGFAAGCGQFDSDITRGRYPRSALGLNDRELIAVVCDGRSDADAGLSLSELAALLVDLGADSAINLDGGGSASLVIGGRLRNSPREEHGQPLPGGRPVSTALVFSTAPA